jgi:hypothetical protein
MAQSVAYPREERAQSRRQRRALLVAILGFCLFVGSYAAGPILAGPAPLISFALIFVFLAGMVLWLGSLFWILYLRFQTTRDVLRRAKVITAPTSAVPAPASSELPIAGTLVGWVCLPAGYTHFRRRLFYLYLTSGVILTAGAIAGIASLAIQSKLAAFQPAATLVLSALLGLTLILVADYCRDLPSAFNDGNALELRFDRAGTAGQFYPVSRYESAGEGFSMKSKWFRRVQATLPAPNAISWKLLQPCVVALWDPSNPQMARISLRATSVPWWSGGLKISIGFLPGDGWLGTSGQMVLIERRQLPAALWWAFQGGSRVTAHYEALTSIGQEAARSFIGVADQSWIGSNSAGRIVTLSPPASEEQLSSWVTYEHESQSESPLVGKAAE